MNIGKVIRELDVEPDEDLVPAPSEEPRQTPAAPEPEPVAPAAVRR